MKFFGNRKHPRYLTSEKSKPGRSRLLTALAMLLVLSGCSWGVYRRTAAPPVTQQSQPQQKPMLALPQPAEVPAEPVLPEGQAPKAVRSGVHNILLCGIDADGLRTDTIMIAHLDANSGKTALLSIPRDCAVEREDGALMKINSVYAGDGEAGVKRLQQRLFQLLGFETDGYVLVDLNAFTRLVDLVGGVWFDVPQDMQYSDSVQQLEIDLHAGRQLLDGTAALGLVRYRSGYAMQDITRTQVQQAFLKELGRACLQLRNLPKLGEFAAVFREEVRTDLTLANILYFAGKLAKCDLSQLHMCTLEGEGCTVNGVSYYPLYAGKLLQTVNESFNPYEHPITQDNIRVITPQEAKSRQKPPRRTSTPELTPPVQIPVQPTEQIPELIENKPLPNDPSLWHSSGQ